MDGRCAAHPRGDGVSIEARPVVADAETVRPRSRHEHRLAESRARARVLDGAFLFDGKSRESSETVKVGSHVVMSPMV